MEIESPEYANPLAVADAALEEAGQFRVRDLDRAFEAANRALNLYAANDHPAGVVRSRIMISWCLSDQAQFMDSYDSARKALELATAEGDREGICASYLQLGITACQAGDLHDSVEYLETSLEHSRQIKSPLLSVRALSNLAAVYGDFKDYDRALDLMHEVFNLLAREPIAISINIVESNHAGFLVKKAMQSIDSGEFEAGVKYAETAQRVLEPVLRRMREQGDTLAFPRTLNSLGKVYCITGQTEELERCKKDLKACALTLGTEQAKGLYFDLRGFVARRAETWSRAARCYSTAASLFSRLNSKTLSHSAFIDASRAAEKARDFERAYYALSAAHHIERAQRESEGARRSKALSLKLSFEKARYDNELLRVKNEMLNRHAQELEVRANYDGMTGVLNRHGLDSALKIIYKRVRRDNARAYLAVLDVDHFKKVNDTYGHLVGDEVLRKIANLMTLTLRRFDIIGRFGGEEFLLVTEQESEELAQVVFARVHSEIESFDWNQIADGLAVTASIGATKLDTAHTLDALLHRADENLYVAKKTGRNRIIWGDDPIAKAA